MRNHSIHRLAPADVEGLHQPGWHGDGGGLYLEVDQVGHRRWILRLMVNGRRRDFGLGPIHKVGIMQAREAAAEYRAKAYRGIDPTEEKRKARQAQKVPTFETAANEVYAHRRASWSNGKHVEQWINTLQDFAFPVIGKKLVCDIGTPEVLQVLMPIWLAKPETARRVRQRIGLILDWARAAGYRNGDNPTQLIGSALPRHKHTHQHHAALPYTEVHAFIAKLRAGTALPITKLAFEFLILTAARTADVRNARWKEVEFAARTWTIPGNDPATGRRMKSGREHVVPLSDRCIAVLAEARVLSPDQDLIFPDAGAARTAMSENRFLIARDGLGYTKERCTPHGFRSSFRDWAAEETSFPSEVVEMALAHTIKNKVEAAYRRGRLLAKRAELMQAWSLYCAPRVGVDNEAR